jgi:2-polyprenyl-3-methyl-5-hydroxy-6-metoxy-1,4-benzoquinol methylase
MTTPASAAAEAGGPQPSSWVIDHYTLLPRGGRILDVACGRGRHALWLARAGFQVHAIDRDRDALASVRQAAVADGLDISVEAVDLETDPPPDLGDARYDAIVVVHYLHRALFPSLKRALKPGGVLLYETFTIAQAARGKPTNPAFLLQPGELAALVAPLHVRAAREGEFDGRFVASIVAQRA